MSRVIKFRAWDGKDMVFTDWDGLTNGAKANDFRIACQNGAEYMQSTGLLDKKGVEVFEGDIVRGAKGNYIKECIGVVEYHGMAFGFWGKQSDGSEWMDTITSTILEPDNIDYNIEVIGNIQQHPHLLEGGKNG